MKEETELKSYLWPIVFLDSSPFFFQYSLICATANQMPKKKGVGKRKVQETPEEKQMRLEMEELKVY